MAVTWRLRGGCVAVAWRLRGELLEEEAHLPPVLHAPPRRRGVVAEAVEEGAGAVAPPAPSATGREGAGEPERRARHARVTAHVQPDPTRAPRRHERAEGARHVHVRRSDGLGVFGKVPAQQGEQRARVGGWLQRDVCCGSARRVLRVPALRKRTSARAVSGQGAAWPAGEGKHTARQWR